MMGVMKGRIMDAERVKYICAVVAQWGQKHVTIYMHTPYGCRCQTILSRQRPPGHPPRRFPPTRRLHSPYVPKIGSVLITPHVDGTVGAPSRVATNAKELFPSPLEKGNSFTKSVNFHPAALTERIRRMAYPVPYTDTSLPGPPRNARKHLPNNRPLPRRSMPTAH